MAVNENLHSYNATTVTSNTPAGGDAIGSDLDDHLRDIKKNVRFAAQLTPSSTSSAAVTMVQTDLNKMLLVDASAAARTVSVLTAAAAATGFRVGVKKVGGANNVVVLRSGSDTIDGATAITLSATNQAVMLASNGTTWMRTSEYVPSDDILGDANVFTKTQSWSKGGDISSASTLVLGDDGNYFDVTGTTGPITAITVPAGTLFMLQFDSTPVLTHHAANLNLPGGANITAAAGDTLVGFATAVNQVKVLHYQRAVARAGWELISSATADDDSAINFTSGITSDYTMVTVVITDMVAASDSNKLCLRMGPSGGLKTGASDYGWGFHRVLIGGGENHTDDSTDSKIVLHPSDLLGNSTNETYSAVVELWNPSSAVKHFVWTRGMYNRNLDGAQIVIYGGGMYFAAAEAITQLSFFMDSGNITSGNFKLYGLLG